MAPKYQNSLHIEWLNTDAFQSFDNQVRKHPASQIRKLVQSIETNGWTVPILVDEQNRIIAGEGRLAAAREIGWTQVPVIRIEHLSKGQVRAYRIADNRLAEEADWDNVSLRSELIELGTLGISIQDTGFEIAEGDIIVGTDSSTSDDEFVKPPVRDKPHVSRIGDIFEIGPHRVLCGDALSSDSYDALLEDDDPIATLIADPPFNVAIAGHVSGTGRHSEFVQASGEMSKEEFAQFLARFLERASAAMAGGATAFIFIDWRSVARLINEIENAGLEMINLCVWAKTNGGMGSLYRSQHELVVVARIPGGTPINNVQLGKFGRNRSNLWTFPGANSPGSEARQQLGDHPTPKPTAMLAEAILDVTKRGDVVLDPFGGSGSTLIAAERTGRVARVMELDPHYVDVILRRAEATLGLVARCARTGCTFAELALLRDRARNVRQRERGRPLNRGGAS